jgi:two-component system nitrate/nitrite response regulator NarL
LQYSAEEPKSVSICDTQPVTAEGMRNLLSSAIDLHFHETVGSLKHAAELVRTGKPDVLIVDKAFGIQAVLEWVAELQGTKTGLVVWGSTVSEAEALRFLQAGARGILRKTAGVPTVLECLRTVSQGRTWAEDCLFRDLTRSDHHYRGELTGREQQVLGLVEQGFKNREIGNELGICSGTVKIHLKHIFQKTGVRGRYGLALNGLRERELMAVSA